MLTIISGEAGMSLVSTMISLAISAALILVVVQTQSNLKKSTVKVEEKDELSTIRDRIRKSTDCRLTLGSNVASLCANAYDPTNTLNNRTYLPLKDSKGRSVGKLNADNSASIGTWRVRASCINSGGDSFVQIAVAKMSRNSNKPNDFATDPLTGKSMSWGPLYKADSRADQNLCSKEIKEPPKGSTTPPTQDRLPSAKTYTEDLPKAPGECGDGLMDLFKGGSAGSLLYAKTVQCREANQVAVSGSLNCVVPINMTFVRVGTINSISYTPEPGLSVGNTMMQILQPFINGLKMIPGAGLIPVPYLTRIKSGEEHGSMISSRPSDDGRGWFFQCCIKSPALLPLPFDFYNPLSWMDFLDHGIDPAVGGWPSGGVTCVDKNGI